MVDDAKTHTAKLLTATGVLWGAGTRLPLEVDDAARVFELLVETDGVLAPGPGTTHVETRAGTAHVLDVDLAARRVRGSDARTLTAVALTSQGVLDDGTVPLEVGEALVVYEVPVEHGGALVPSTST